MTASELKYNVEQAGHDTHFFTRETMAFFGDRMRNYGVRRAFVRCDYDGLGNYHPGVMVPAWELYRKRPVKHGLTASAYFGAVSFRRLHPSAETNGKGE